MVYLLLCVLCCSSLLLFFKWFEKYEVDFLQGIVLNYLTCALIGSLFTDFSSLSFQQAGWVWYALLLGVLFISIFFLSSLTTKYLGVAVGTISMKLGVIFPILIGLIIYKEAYTWVTLLGIFLALLAVVFSSVKFKKIQELPAKVYFLPFIVWVGSGICDSTVQFVNNRFFSHGSGFEAFVLLVFFIAFLAGFITLLAQKASFQSKNIVGGILLGIPNYGSMYFLFKALDELQHQYQFSSSSIFTLNNISVVLLSSIFAIVFFKEKLNRLNWLGLLLALISIVCISYKG